VTRISQAGQLLHRTDSIRQIRDVGGKFRVSFSEHASWYRTTAPVLQQCLRTAQAEEREVSFSTSPDCEIFSVTMNPPRSFARRIADRFERLTNTIIWQTTRWWREAQRRATKRPSE
jgi:hypothetical protein